MHGGPLLGGLILVAELATATDYGTFDNPANNARMKFRYWLPDASVDISTVQSDIEAAGAVGAGAVELLPLYNYGGSLAGPTVGADWAKYGFGTPAFNEVFKASLQAAKDAGMCMDFALGPNQGQGVPAKNTDPGLHWDLAPFNVSIPKNGSYQDQIPGWGTGELVALVSARVLSASTITNPASSTFSTPANNATRLVLAADSLQLHTDKVREDGTVSLLFNGTKHQSHHLFAYFQYQDLVKNLDIENHTTGTIFDNGSYTVDHYSARGAETTKKFWENHILNDTTIKTLLGEVGTYGWEDSIEINSNISWTPELPTKFEKLHGYTIHKFLPLLMYGNNNPGVQPSYPGDLECVLDSQDKGAGYVNDFRAALAQGYGDYLTTFTTWLEGLGLGYSAQVSYNLPLDMETNIDRVTAPECESLAFNDNIDGYRQFSGAANVAQKTVISNEMGADLEQALALPLAQLLWQINIAFSGGINQVVLHGQTFTGDYYQTTWPGYLAFFLLFADSYMDKQPSWLWGLPDAIGYINRNQFILHQGKPRVDVAIYNKVSYTDPQLATLYHGSDLVDAGFTYNYLNPTNLNFSQAYVSGNLLAHESPAYQALVVPSYENLTWDAISMIQGFADSGLPVILSEDLPGYYYNGNCSEHMAVYAGLQTLKNSRNVHRAADGQIASTLQALNIRPRVQTITTNNTIWYPVMRSDNDTDYVYVFSKDTADTGYLIVNSTKTPYIFNSWTGERMPLLSYRLEGNTTKIPLSLTANQTVILAFNNEWKAEVDTPSVHATLVPSNVLAEGLVVHATKGSSRSSYSLKLSNGKTYDISTNATLAPVSLSNWTLTAEHWKAPQNMSDVTTIADKHNTTHHLTSLVSWLDIPGLHNASGLGYYSTQFSWQPVSSSQTGASGAYLSLPAIAHGLKLFVNGQAVETLDFANPLVDIGPFLHSGNNKILAIVPTLMWNYIRSIYDEILISGSKPDLTTLPSNVDTGLIGEAKIIPYTDLRVSI
ncbi:uncharacterized protein N7484_010957 [Penicillium longicatenatum]|uniref:uncharacterized protein n=1 Tax=Penicillium longicatenatum TaxID=1561947 RepID=UPI00254759AC|nr:uncharacterized protein N7484_010957 [Penicillium longicatenatum]KAJ5630857.1 hypothetical protein N7484_010957 [Penicillium longicatenatum]